MSCGSRRFGAAQGGLAPCQQTFRGNMAGAGCAITAPKFSQFFFSFSKLLVVVLGPVSVEELFSVEDAPSAHFRSAPGFR